MRRPGARLCSGSFPAVLRGVVATPGRACFGLDGQVLPRSPSRKYYFGVRRRGDGIPGLGAAIIPRRLFRFQLSIDKDRRSNGCVTRQFRHFTILP